MHEEIADIKTKITNQQIKIGWLESDNMSLKQDKDNLMQDLYRNQQADETVRQQSTRLNELEV